MFLRIFQICFVAGMLVLGGQAYGQSCGGDDTANNCGKDISQSEAAALWSNYCTESCNGKQRCGLNLFRGHRGCGLNPGSRCGDADCGVTDCGASDCGCRDNACAPGCLKSRLGGIFSGGNCGCGCGCELGCFGYPSTCGGCNDGCGGLSCGGCNDSCGCGGIGLFSRIRGKVHGKCGCGGGKLRGLLGRLHGDGCGCGLRGMFSGRLFLRSASRCGEPCAYFGEAVGHEYGNAGMQSCVSGCGSTDEAASETLEPKPADSNPPKSDSKQKKDAKPKKNNKKKN